MSDVVTEDAKSTALGTAVFSGVVARPTRGGRHARRRDSQPARRRPATAGSVADRDGARHFLPAAAWDTVPEGVTQRRALLIGAGGVEDVVAAAARDPRRSFDVVAGAACAGTESAPPSHASLAVDLAVCGRTLGSMHAIRNPRRRRGERRSPTEDAMP